jgi:hypothetical protein
MASNWIIIGALAILAAIVFLLFKSISDEIDTTSGHNAPGGKGRDRAKGAPSGR